MKYFLLFLSMIIGANAFGQIVCPVDRITNHETGSPIDIYVDSNGVWHKDSTFVKLYQWPTSHYVDIMGDTLIVSDTSIHFIKVGGKAYRVVGGLEYIKTKEDIFADSLISSWHLDGGGNRWIMHGDGSNGIGIEGLNLLMDSSNTCIPYLICHSKDTVKWTPIYWFFGQDKEWHEVKDIEKVHKRAGELKRNGFYSVQDSRINSNDYEKVHKNAGKIHASDSMNFVGGVTSFRGEPGVITFDDPRESGIIHLPASVMYVKGSMDSILSSLGFNDKVNPARQAYRVIGRDTLWSVPVGILLADSPHFIGRTVEGNGIDNSRIHSTHHSWLAVIVIGFGSIIVALIIWGAIIVMRVMANPFDGMLK